MQSVSPIDTIRSLVSPRLTPASHNGEAPKQEPIDPSIYISCLNDYFQMSSLTSVVGLSFRPPNNRICRTTSEEVFTNPLDSDFISQSPITIHQPLFEESRIFQERDPDQNRSELDSFESLLAWETEPNPE